MTITQLEVNENTIWSVLTEENNYLVKFSTPKGKNYQGKEMPPLPYGLSFRQLKSMSVGELSELLKNGRIAVVHIDL